MSNNNETNETVEAPEVFETKRPTVQALEEIIGRKFSALNDGFVRLIDYMGNDDAIVQMARVSYGKGTKKASEDRGLIRYLLRHAHTTPFEGCEIKLHVKMPIFVARQWIRHRTANVNEYSARYSIMDKEFYVPQPEHLAAQSTTNKQGRSDVLSAEEASKVLQILKMDAEDAYTDYTYMLNEDENGNPKDPNRSQLARELARMNLSLNFYTQFYWKIDLHNLMHFCSLRSDSHAQYEIRVFSDIILHEIMKLWVPNAYEAFKDYDHRQGGIKLSRMELEIVRQVFKIADPDPNYVIEAFENSGVSKREADEFIKKVMS